jgi:hypothetical protein
MGVIVAPIIPGKLDAWKDWIAELMGPRNQEFEDLNKRYGLTRHAAWLAETPEGQVVVALHQGPGGDDFMPKLGTSTHPFDTWFKERIKAVHGIDLSQPPPGPMPTLFLDSGQG